MIFIDKIKFSVETERESWERFKQKAQEAGTNGANLLRMLIEAVNSGELKVGFTRQSKGDTLSKE